MRDATPPPGGGQFTGWRAAQAMKAARKDVEKQRKVRSALDSKPTGYLEALRSEVDQLADQLSAFELPGEVREEEIKI